MRDGADRGLHEPVGLREVAKPHRGGVGPGGARLRAGRRRDRGEREREGQRRGREGGRVSDGGDVGHGKDRTTGVTPRGAA